jgi:hypothetical protein
LIRRRDRHLFCRQNGFATDKSIADELPPECFVASTGPDLKPHWAKFTSTSSGR